MSVPLRLEPGSRLFLELVNDRVPGPFQVSGRVAGSSMDAPWRSGIAFDEASVALAARFFERLAAACAASVLVEDEPREGRIVPLTASTGRFVSTKASAPFGKTLASAVTVRWAGERTSSSSQPPAANTTGQRRVASSR